LLEAAFELEVLVSDVGRRDTSIAQMVKMHVHYLPTRSAPYVPRPQSIDNDIPLMPFCRFPCEWIPLEVTQRRSFVDLAPLHLRAKFLGSVRRNSDETVEVAWCLLNDFSKLTSM
jgi:hypothetical protein